MSGSNHPNVGSTLDSLLQGDGVLDEVTAVAAKRVLAMNLQIVFAESGLTKTAIAQRMGKSRAQLNRLLDPNDTGVTLHTIFAGARALGLRVRITLEMDKL